MNIDSIINNFTKIDFKTTLKDKSDKPEYKPRRYIEKALVYQNKKYLDWICSLIDYIRNHEKCLHFQEKTNEVHDFKRFDSFISECEFVYYYLNQGCIVDFVTDTDNRFNKKSPDLIINSNNKEVFMEITSLKEIYPIDILFELQDIIRKIGNPNIILDFRIKFSIENIWEQLIDDMKNENSKKLSQTYESISKSINEFYDMIMKNNYELKDDTYDFEAVSLKITPSGDGKQHIIGGSSVAFWCNPKFLREFLEIIIKRKGIKLIDNENHLSYYIGLDFHPWFYDNEDFKRVLYSDDGLFRTFALSKEISGLVTIVSRKPKINLFHNPHAREERFDSNYEWLGNTT